MNIKVTNHTADLYKRGVKGEVRVWRMEQGETADGLGAHRVVSGIEGGAMTESGWNICEPKNVGRSNATSSIEQAVSEIANNFRIKSERGYFAAMKNIDNVEFTKPMLAQDWDKRKAKVKVADGVFAQPKLDGMRCIARADGLWTRTGKRIVSCPHIAEALVPFFEANPDVELDGELYNHAYRDRFNELMSILRKEKPSEADLAESKAIAQYHIYDIAITNLAFSGRVHFLLSLFKTDFADLDCLCRVETVFVDNHDSLDGLYATWIEAGFEGQMVRLNEDYEHKRSNTLMKRKDFITEEFPVIGMEEGKGNWAGCVKRFIVQLPNWNTCEATPRGTQAALAALLASGEVPDWATVRHFGYTPDGKLRFPIATDYGNGKRVD